MSDLVDRLEALIAEVERRLEEDGDCDTLVAEINALSGCDYSEDDFFELHSWTSPARACRTRHARPRTQGRWHHPCANPRINRDREQRGGTPGDISSGMP